MTDALPEPGKFGAAFQDFVQAMTAAAERPESGVSMRLREHLGVEPRELATTAAEFVATEHPNLQLALDAVLPDAELIGYFSPNFGYSSVSIFDLLASKQTYGMVEPGPAQYTDVEVGDGRVVRCVTTGIYLAERDDAPVVLAVDLNAERPFGGASLRLLGLSPRDGVVSELIRELRSAMLEHNVYRGRVISLHAHQDNSVSVQFHTLAPVERDSVILPDDTLERLERHAIGIAAQARVLVGAGRHLKRGVLLHGPPGTGKTLSVSYLLGAMPGRTTVMLTGRGLGLIEQAVGIARQLAPATVVFEDIDLVAAERTFEFAHGGALFDLLNQMEGMDEDADLLFVLTTNRPDVIEPALAARPGRVDLALEIPLPDETSRSRLIRLYGRDIELDDAAAA